MTKKILVVGDSMLDIRLNSAVERLCPEAPLPIYDVYNTSHYGGGAANVALNIHKMGGDVTLLTPITHDAAGTTLMDILISSDLEVIPTPCEATTTKTRVFTESVMRARIDDDNIVSIEEAEQLAEKFKTVVDSFDTIVFSDYGKNSLFACQSMLRACGDKTTLVDPKGTNWEKYTGAKIVKANAAEVMAMRMRPVTLLETYRIGALVRTAGEAGYSIHRPNRREVFAKAYAVDSIDPTGAGDSFLAAMSVALTNGLPLEEACALGGIAGALATTFIGTATITDKDIEQC